MFACRDPTHQKPPLRVEEELVHDLVGLPIFAWRKLEQVDIGRRDGQVIIVIRLIYQRENAIRESNVLEDEKQSFALR